MPGVAAVKRRVLAYDEDSSDSEGEVKKKGKQTKRHRAELGQEMKEKSKKVKRSSPGPNANVEEILSASLISEVCYNIHLLMLNA